MWEARIGIYVTAGTVIIAFITAILGFRSNSAKLNDIHVLVNSNYAAINERVNQLITCLHENGIEVPPPAAPAKTE